MKLHSLKIKDEYFREVVAGRKTFELRKNDRDFQVGDQIQFKVIENSGFIEDSLHKYEITYVLKNVPEYGLDKDYAILSIKEIKE